MRRIREILLTQYIGAIVIGMLISQALVGVIGLLMQPILWYQRAERSGSVFGSSSPSFPLSQLLSPALTAVLYIVVSYFLLAWLYRETKPPKGGEDEEHQEAQS